MKSSTWLLAALIAAGNGSTHAQTPTADASAPAGAADTAAIAAPAELSPNATGSTAACCVIPAGTIVELEIAEPLSSALQKRGDKFTIKLHTPLIHEGMVIVPAGTAGIGEIVHAESARGGGKPGELLLAARHLQHNTTQLPLRGLKFGGNGQDKTQTALGVAVAVGPFAHFVRGRNFEIPAGTLVNAKLAQDLLLPATGLAQHSTPAVPAAPAAPNATQQE